MHTLASAVAFLLLIAAGCGGSGAVGSHCGNDNDCDQSQHLMCNTSLPDGYCTFGCAVPGQIANCPGNSICGTVNNIPMCLHICNSLVDCRVKYSCSAVTGSTSKACQP